MLDFGKGCIASDRFEVLKLLASSSATNVETTILLLMRCGPFQIDGFEARLWKMLLLVFSQNKSIYSAVEDAFITINLMKNPTKTVVNLLNLDIESSTCDPAALEFIVGSLASKGDISTITKG